MSELRKIVAKALAKPVKSQGAINKWDTRVRKDTVKVALVDIPPAYRQGVAGDDSTTVDLKVVAKTNDTVTVDYNGNQLEFRWSDVKTPSEEGRPIGAKKVKGQLYKMKKEAQVASTAAERFYQHMKAAESQIRNLTAEQLEAVLLWMEDATRRWRGSLKSVKSQIANEWDEIEKLDKQLIGGQSKFLNLIDDKNLDKDLNERHTIMRTLDRSKTVGSQYDPSFLAEECIRLATGGHHIGAAYTSVQSAYKEIIAKDRHISEPQKDEVKRILAQLGHTVSDGKPASAQFKKKKAQLIPQGNYMNQPADPNQQVIDPNASICPTCGGQMVKKIMASGVEAAICPVCDANIVNTAI